MKKDWLYYIACIIFPHVMLIVGLIFLARTEARNKMLGKRLCIFSTLILIVGSFAYYMFFTPFFGLD